MWDLQKYADNIALRDDCGHVLTYGQLATASVEFAEAVGGRCLILSSVTTCLAV